MDYKAFKKISAEAEEAFLEHRFYDVLSFIIAINKDMSFKDLSQEIQNLRHCYDELLKVQFSDHPFPEERKVHEVSWCFNQATILFSDARYCWLLEHQPTHIDQSTAQMLKSFGDDELLKYLEALQQYPEGKELDASFFKEVDGAFMLLWTIMGIRKETFATLREQLPTLNLFAQRTLVPAVLGLVMRHFSQPHLELLLEWGNQTSTKLNAMEEPEADEEDNETAVLQSLRDLQARITVSLTLIARRHCIFLLYLPELYDKIQQYLGSPLIIKDMPEVLRAIVNQSLTDRVDKRVDDIMPIIKEAFEKQQPHLGSSSDDDNESKENKVEVHAIRIDSKSSNRFFRKMSDYARGIDELRKCEMDVNATSMRYMKHFKFFNHPAHWFYPFITEYPDLHDGLNINGKLSQLAQIVMASSRFCDSDRYSFASMMDYVHEKSGKDITSQLMTELDKMEEEEEDDEDFGAGHHDFSPKPQEMTEEIMAFFKEMRLSPYINYCQILYRFFTHINVQPSYPDIFTLEENPLLPCQPFFRDLYTSYEQIEPSTEMLLKMGANEEVIKMCSHATETFGTSVHMLQARGLACMNLKLWQSALSDFQQAQLFEEDPDIALSMARCYEAKEEWEEALPLLQQELERQADEAGPDIIEEVARCHIQLKQWDEAASLFFRLEFMERHLTVARRGIAWCSLHQGKYERAEQYYRQLIEDKKHRSWEDRINLGHALWLQRKREEALLAYRQFVTRFNRTKKDQRGRFSHWTEAFMDDAHNLLWPHFSYMDIALMQDAISQKN